MNLANKMFQVACERVYINNKHHFSSGGIGSINCSNVERVGSSAGRLAQKKARPKSRDSTRQSTFIRAATAYSSTFG